MLKSKKMLIYTLSACLLLTGCAGAIAGGGIVAKALSWLTFWKKDDVSTSSMTEEERMRAAFADYTDIAKTAMENAKNGLIPAQNASTEDVEYLVTVNDLTLLPYDFFAVWLENYQKNNPSSDFSEIGGLVTVENLQAFFTDSYFESKSKTDYISTGGTVYADETAALAAASVRAEKRGLRDEKQTQLDNLEPEEYIETYVDNPDYAEAKSNYESFLEAYNTQTNGNAKSAMYPILQAYYDIYMSTPSKLKTVTYTDNTEKILALQAEIVALNIEIENSKIKITTTVEINRKDTVISDLGLDNENVNMISKFLQDIAE